MLKKPLLACVLALSSLSVAFPANAFSLYWRFVSTNGPVLTNPNAVDGTIDGLTLNSSSDGSGVTVTVTGTPSGALLGGTYDFVNTANGGSAFVVDAAGNVTFADALFTDSSGSGTQLQLGGYGGYSSSIFDPSSSIGWVDISGTTSFSSSSFGTPTPVPFDFEPTSALVILGGLFVGKKLHNRLTKK
jgi:hypothetical protein